MRKTIILAVSAFLGAVSLLAQTPSGSPQEKYIQAYSAIAVAEMQRTGVPASITLGQGILESSSGLSTLAVNGNNHFGIKCHSNWNGRTMYRDDDRKNECFRVYDTPQESFHDHSDFLRYRDRYKFLFDLERTDYKGWAFGLKQAGYATDPGYAAKLIRIIEENNLSRFDFLTPEEAMAIPESPARIEEPVPAKKQSSHKYSASPVAEQFRFSLSRIMYSLNDVPFVYAQEGESYRSIARAHHLFLFEILRYNEVGAEAELLPGTIVYLEAKKRKAPRGLDMYIVSADGEDLHAICQRFAVKKKSVMKLNGLTADSQLREGDIIKLR